MLLSPHDHVRPDRAALASLAAPAGGHLAAELAETLKLAAPMAATQLGQIAMMTTDLAFIGRLGDAAVAAAALAGTIYFVAFTVGMGLMSAVAPLAAQAFGAGDPRGVRRSLRAGLWAALLISLPIMVFPLRGEQILHALGQADEPARLAQQYLFGLVWGVAPALWFIAIRGFMGAVNRPQPIFWITLAAIPLNALLVYLLLYGEFGLPHLGLFGVGLASASVNGGTFLAGLWFATQREAVQALSRPGAALAHRLGADAPAHHHRRADLDRLPAGIRTVLVGRAADGHDLDHGAGRASDRAAGHRDPVHDPLRHQHGRDRAGRACRRRAMMPPASGAPAWSRCGSASPLASCSRSP